MAATQVADSVAASATTVRYGVAALHDNRYLFVALLAALVAFFFSGIGRRLAKPMLYLDAISLGLFAVVVLLRLASLWLGWRTPEPRDYTEHVVGLPRRMLSWTPFYPKPDDGPGGADEGVDEAPQDVPGDG